ILITSVDKALLGLYSYIFTSKCDITAFFMQTHKYTFYVYITYCDVELPRRPIYFKTYLVNIKRTFKIFCDSGSSIVKALRGDVRG
ncbi:8698_t:CDS:2, partial [Funneliformis geosporum]